MKPSADKDIKKYAETVQKLRENRDLSDDEFALLFPYALIPSTTALGTIHPQGRELGLCAGANVVMPNLSPTEVRELYSLYENKICTGEEAAQCRGCLENRVLSAGYQIVTDIGDVRR